MPASLIEPTWPRLAALAAVIVLLIAWLALRRRRVPLAPRAVLGPRELRLQAALEAAAGRDARVWPRVRADAALGAGRGVPRGRGAAARRRLARARFDFLVCTTAEARPLVAVRVSDEPSGREGRIIAEAAGRAGLPLLDIALGEAEDTAALRERLAPHLESGHREAAGDPWADGQRREPILDLPPE